MADRYRPEPRLNPTIPVPKFELPTLRDDPLTDAKLAQGAFVLIFHRYAACPLCASKMAEYRVRIRELGSVVHYPIFHSPADKLRRFIPDWEAHPFDIPYDIEKKVYEKFGVGESAFGLLHPGYFKAKVESAPYNKDGRGPKEYDKTLKTMPASFLVRDGQIVAANYGSHWADIWHVDEALRQIKAIFGEIPT